tara:strand:+ start:8043 stop:8924 length:882 start_codon:yes stop_codon:yes gene_type:complete
MPLIKRKNCPICDSRKFSQIFVKKYTDQKLVSFLNKHFNNNLPLKLLKNKLFVVNECSICKVLFQKFIFNERFHKKLYEKFVVEEISKNKKKEFSTNNFQTYLNELRAIEKILKKKPKSIKILEIGAGWGLWSSLAKACNFNVEAIEISLTRIKHMRKNNITVHSNLKKIKNRKFDVIYMDQTFEHIQSPYSLLKKLKFILNKGGLFIVKVPSGISTKKKLNYNYEFKDDELIPLEHINTYNYKTFNFISKKFDLKFIFTFSKHQFFSIWYYKDLIKNILNYFTNKNIIFKKN